MNIVLLEPEIPANTGNIGRTCVATGTALHLIEPLGFLLREKELKRAGMDYWPLLDLLVYDDWADFLAKNPQARLVMASTKGRIVYSDFSYRPDDFLVFGKESAGIPEEILAKHPDTCVRIPMNENIRSLNLANSVAVLLYEALRQNDFVHMQREGHLKRLEYSKTESEQASL